MNRDDLSDFPILLALADEGSFTRAAARLGTSQSAVSLTIRRLEARLGFRLVTRTTRSVALTEAGERLVASIRPALRSIDDELAALSADRDRPAGHFRLTAGHHAIETVLWPKLKPFLAAHPDISVELVAEQGLTDIVEKRFDAGVRLGESVEKDMVAVPIAPKARMCVVAAPSHLAGRPLPDHPEALAEHNCIGLKMESLGGLYAWEFEKDGREIRVRTRGQLAFSSVFHVAEAARSGFGIGFVHEDLVRDDLASGRLVELLSDWTPPFAGYHLYYPARNRPQPAFRLMVEALRHRG